MSEVSDRLGTIERHGDDIDVRFERFYTRPPESVWKALTDPDRMADWLGQSLVQPFVGGRYEIMLDGLKPMRGIVRVWEPRSLLEYEWRSDHAPEAVARWELTATDKGTRLVLKHLKMPYANANLMIPGWHVYLEHLNAALSGDTPIDFNMAWRSLQNVYAEQLGLQELTREP